VVYVLDLSGSMNERTSVLGEGGEVSTVPKIEQLNEGWKRSKQSLIDLDEKDPLHSIYYQVIHLDSYGQAQNPRFEPIAHKKEEVVNFEAGGCTVLSASLKTLLTFVDHKYLIDERPARKGKSYNKAVIVILMSDGQPTDENGCFVPFERTKKEIDECKRTLYERGIHHEFYSIAVGDDADADVLREFCDGGSAEGELSRFYRVEDGESIADVLNFVSRASIKNQTTRDIENGNLDGDEAEQEQLDAAEEEQRDDVDALPEADPVPDPAPVPADADDAANAQDDAGQKAGGERRMYQIETDKCRNGQCGACMDKCPEKAIEMQWNRVMIDPDRCSGCGACLAECPHGAIFETEFDTTLDNWFEDLN